MFAVLIGAIILKLRSRRLAEEGNADAGVNVLLRRASENVDRVGFTDLVGGLDATGKVSICVADSATNETVLFAGMVIWVGTSGVSSCAARKVCPAARTDWAIPVPGLKSGVGIVDSVILAGSGIGVVSGGFSAISVGTSMARSVVWAVITSPSPKSTTNPAAICAGRKRRARGVGDAVTRTGDLGSACGVSLD